MSDIWLISDQHYNHANIVEKFKSSKNPSEPLRPFKTVKRMNEEMIERHNSVVKPTDTVFFGGDIGQGIRKVLDRLCGKKILVLGNHDKLEFDEYRKFSKVVSWKFFPDFPAKFVLSHYPLHPMSFVYKDGGFAFNVHGHIHDKVVKQEDGTEDPRYFNISVEQINYTPVHVEVVAEILNKRKENMLNGRKT